MNKKRGFIAYDVFKLIISALLLFLIMILWVSFSKKTSPEDAAPALSENQQEETTTAAANEDTAAAAQSLPTPQTEAEAELAPNLPAFPEPNEGWSFDSAKGVLLNAAGTPLYRLNEDGNGWTPLVPADLQSLKLSAEGGKWTLGDDSGAKYAWDAATHSWQEIPQEQAAEDAAQDETEQDEAAQDEVAEASSGDCAGVAPPRLVAGEKAEVLANVNFRSSPGIADNWVTTLYSGTRLKVLGESVCLPYGRGAYRWWKLEQEDGTIGWMAEAPISGTNYFLAPAQ